MSSVIVASTLGPRSLTYSNQMRTIQAKFDPLDLPMSRRIRETPYFVDPNFASNSDATWGKRGVAYTINPENQLYNSVYDMLEHVVDAPAVLDPGSTYVEAPGLRMINRVEFRIGNETIMRLDYAGLFMWMLMQDAIVRDVYLRGVLFGSTHNNAELAAPHEFCLSLPNAFDSIVNTIKTRRIPAKLEYIVDYANFADVIRNIGISVPGPITQNHVEYGEIAAQRSILEGHANRMTQDLNMATFDVEQGFIPAGSTNFGFQLNMPKRIRKIFFYITDTAAADPNFAPVAVREWYFMAGNAKFPRYGLTPIRNRVMLAENLRTDFKNLDIYGWVFEHATLTGDEDRVVKMAHYDLAEAPSTRIVCNFAAPLATDHQIHILYEYDAIMHVDAQGIVKMQ